MSDSMQIIYITKQLLPKLKIEIYYGDLRKVIL